MDFQSPLYKAFLIRRYSKVLADVHLETGETATVFCSNTTRMISLADPKTEICLSYRDKEFRRLQFVWETAVVNGSMVGVNMSRQKDLIIEAVMNATIYELGGYAKIEKINPSSASSSYLDLILTPEENSGYPVCKVAIAPVYQKKGAELLFPDGIDVANHHTLKQLAAALQAGERAVLILLAQRIDCIGARAQWTADAQYLMDLKELCDKGLEIICCGCSVSLQGIWVTARLPFTF